MNLLLEMDLWQHTQIYFTKRKLELFLVFFCSVFAINFFIQENWNPSFVNRQTVIFIYLFYLKCSFSSVDWWWVNKYQTKKDDINLTQKKPFSTSNIMNNNNNNKKKNSNTSQDIKIIGPNDIHNYKWTATMWIMLVYLCCLVLKN